MQARSVSPFAAELLAGPQRAGTAIGHGYIRFGDDVIAVTRPGATRMPNGIEADLALEQGEHAWIGDGELRTSTVAIAPGPLWDPRPHPRIARSIPSRLPLELATLPGSGPGLTPLGDDILVGYLAGAALAGADQAILHTHAESAGRRTTALSRTLLRLAAHGHLPEAAHPLLERGDTIPLLAFGATSGKGITVGLALAGWSVRTADTERAQAETAEVVPCL